MLSRRREELDPLSGNELWHGHHRLTAFSLAITLELLVLVPLATLLGPEQKEMGHTCENTNTYSFKRADRGGFVKGSVSSWIDGSRSQTPLLVLWIDGSRSQTPYLFFIRAQIRPGYKVLVAEAATSIVAQSRAATSFVQTTWL